MRRDVLLPAAVALIIVPLVFSNRRNAGVSVVAAMTTFLPISLVLLLHPEPLAFGLTHLAPGRGGIGIKAGVTMIEKLEWLTRGSYGTLIFALSTLALLQARRFRPSWLPVIAAVGALVTGIALIAELMTHFTFADENPLTFCPLAVLGIWAVLFLPKVREEQRTVMALWSVAAFGTLAVIFAEYDSGGAQWGPRYLLFVFPLLVLLALRARQELLSGLRGALRHRIFNYSFVVILALSFFMQGLGVTELLVKQELAATTITRIEKLRPHVIVSASSLIDMLAPMYSDHSMLYASSQQDLTKLMHRIRMKRLAQSVTMVCDPRIGCRWNGYSGWSHTRVGRVKNSLSYAVYTRTS